VIRKILHLDMDAFFVSVEQARNPSLRGRPVIVGGNPQGRGVVSAASYEARRYGVRSAMPLAQARRLCPQAVFIQGDHHLYAEISREVFRILGHYCPLVEPVSIDEAYLDLTGCERLHGPPLEAACKIREEIFRTLGLSASIGISTNRLVSKVASKMAKPAGILEVRPGYEADFLAPLPVEVLPGVGPKTRKTLRLLNIRTVGELATLDHQWLERALGRTGYFLHLRARGLDDSPVTPQESPPRSIGREVTLEEDTLDRRRLEGILYRLSERVGDALRRRGLRARCVQLKLRYSDFDTRTRSVTLWEPTDMDHVIFQEARRLMERLLCRRVRVRLLGVSTSGLMRAPLQLPLFARERSLRRRALYRALDCIRGRYGWYALQVGRAIQESPGGFGPSTIFF
jgi:DNA polymerase-4